MVLEAKDQYDLLLEKMGIRRRSFFQGYQTKSANAGKGLESYGSSRANSCQR